MKLWNQITISVSVSWFMIWCLCVVSCVLCFNILSPFCVRLCAPSSMSSPLSFPLPPCMFVSLCVSILFPSCFLLSVFPLLSNLSSFLLSPRLFLVPSSACLCIQALGSHVLFVSVVCDVSPEVPAFPWVSPVPPLYVLDFDFCFFYVWFELCLFVCTLTASFATLFFGPWIHFCLLHSALLNKDHLLFSPNLPPCFCIWVHLVVFPFNTLMFCI